MLLLALDEMVVGPQLLEHVRHDHAAAVGAGLLPIALGYLIAHYLTYLLISGQGSIRLVTHLDVDRADAAGWVGLHCLLDFHVDVARMASRLGAASSTRSVMCVPDRMPST